MQGESVNITIKSSYAVQLERRTRKKRILFIAAELTARLAISFSAGVGAALMLVPIAMAERGYQAIGGEWFGSVFVSFITFMLTKNIFKEKKDER